MTDVVRIQNGKQEYFEVDQDSDGVNTPVSLQGDEDDDTVIRNPLSSNHRNSTKYNKIETVDESSHSFAIHDEPFDDSKNGSEIPSQGLTALSPFLTRLCDWLFPPNIPRKLQLWKTDNIALPISYLLVGTFQGLSTGVMTVFLLNMGATEAQQTTIRSLRSLPATFKVLFGFLSDTVPLFGYKRKGYMFIGWSLASLSMAGLVVIETSKVDGSNYSSNIPLVSLLYFMFGLGFWFADVIADSIMAEKAREEPNDLRGQLQSLCYACRFFMLMVTIAFATFAYEKLSPVVVFVVLAILPWFTIVPALWFMYEERDVPIKSVSSQCAEIWSTVCSRAVWQPMAFIFIYTSLGIGNSAWTQYQYTVLKFTTVEINSFLVGAYIFLYIGVMVYKTFLTKKSWRVVYYICTVLNLFFSVLQILLVLQLNRRIGLSNYLFALGDDAMAEFVYGISYLPTIVMMVHLCPEGQEGASFALFTTVDNSAIHLASAISTSLLGVWDVSKAALKAGHLSGFLKLTILTTAIQFSGILFIWLLPSGQDELKRLDHGPKSKLGGAVFLFTISAAILWAVVSGVLNIVDPGWQGES